MLHELLRFQIFSLQQGFLGGPAEVHLKLLPIEPRRHGEGGGGPWRRSWVVQTSRAAWTGSGLRMTAAGFPAPGWSLRVKVPRPHHTGDCCCMLCRDQMSSFTDHGKGNSNHRHHTASICISIVQSPIERLLVTKGRVFADSFVTCQESRHSHCQCQCQTPGAREFGQYYK